MTDLDLRPLPLDVAIARMPGADPDLPLPDYRSIGAAGLDLAANLPFEIRADGLTLASMERHLVPTGLAIALPPGMEGQVRPRSGLALRQGLTLINSPGTIDSDYRGEILLPMINLGQEAVTIAHGDRVAQLVVAAVAQVVWHVVEGLGETQRGTSGFGSTGVSRGSTA
ncbi:MAG: dUTP diphosphatase [Pseudomonadota bacterium]